MSKSYGGIYTFICTDPKCGNRFESFCWVDQIDKQKCKCGKSAQLLRWANYQKGCDYARPVLSESMGIDSSQVQEHRRVHPDIPITDDGRVIIASHAEGKRIRKKLGFFDRDGYSR